MHHGTDHEVEAPEQLFPREVRQRAFECGGESGYDVAKLVEDEVVKALVGLGESPADETGEGGSATLSLHHFERRLHKRPDDTFDRGHGVCSLDPVEKIDPAPVERAQSPRQNLAHQSLLRAEVVVHRGQIGACGLGYRAQGRPMDALLSKEILRGVEQAGFGVGGPRGLRTGPVGIVEGVGHR